MAAPRPRNSTNTSSSNSSSSGGEAKQSDGKGSVTTTTNGVNDNTPDTAAQSTPPVHAKVPPKKVVSKRLKSTTETNPNPATGPVASAVVIAATNKRTTTGNSTNTNSTVATTAKKLSGNASNSVKPSSSSAVTKGTEKTKSVSVLGKSGTGVIVKATAAAAATKKKGKKGKSGGNAIGGEVVDQSLNGASASDEIIAANETEGRMEGDLPVSFD